MQHGVTQALFAAALVAAASFAQAQIDEPTKKALSVDFESPAVVIAGNATLTEADLQAHVESIPERDRAAFVNSPRRVADTAEQQTRQEQLAQAGLDAGLLDDPVRSAQIYRAAVEKLATWQMEQVIEARKLDDYEQQGRELFLSNPDRFREPPTFSFTHLLVGVAERSEVAAMRQVLALVDQLAEGADFEALVVEHSEDGTVEENRGRYESVPAERLDENFARALRELEPGEISGPVRSRFGWHIIRLDEIHQGSVKDWEAAREEAMKLAEQRHADRIREAYMQELTAGQRPDIAPDLVRRLQQKYGAGGDQASQP